MQFEKDYWPAQIYMLRDYLNLSAKEFGQLLEPPASQSIVSRWERGVNLPSKSRLKSIQKLLSNECQICHEPFNEIPSPNRTGIPLLKENFIEKQSNGSYDLIFENYVHHPIYFCPYCGRDLRKEVKPNA